MKKITIKDIAKLANVSVSTVSNVINDKGKCSIETKERIFSIMKDFNYNPNQAARTLASKKSNLIGILFPLNDEVFRKNNSYRKIINSITSELSKESYDLVIRKNDSSLDLYEWSLKRDLEGLIIIGDVNTLCEASIQKLKIPVVFIDNYENNFLGVNYINSDDTIGGYEATEVLIKNGCKNIAFVGDDTLETHNRRLLGYQNALLEYSIGNENIYFQKNDFESGKLLGEQIAKDNIDGLCVSSDIMALGIMSSINLYRKIPEDIKIIGFDNSDACDYTTPTLSSVDLSYQSKGILAVKMIFDELNNLKYLKNRSIDLKIYKRGTIISPIK